jgi:N utilization substance protein A
MRSQDLVSSFGEIARSKDIDRDSLQIIVEDVIRAMIRKRYGADEAFEIIFNPSQGDIQILHIQEVVPDWTLEDPVTQIEESHAQKIDEDFEAGDEVASEMDISDFGRRAVMTARQTFRQRIRDVEKEKTYEEYSELIGEIVVGEIYQTRRRDTLLMHEGTEMVLPRSEQIPGESRGYRKGNMLRAVVEEVRRDAGSDPQVVLSRTSPVFMERLFEVEVPEVYDGIVEIKKVARIPGDRAKVAVVSHDDRVDPVGACVGVKGVRIHAVVRELNDENIDVMQWSDDPHTFIARALSPADPVSVKINEDADPPRARVEVVDDEVSQAIGKRGVNIKLATQLTGYEIDVFREIPADEEDIDIEEFGDELSEETVAKLKQIGCDTGKAVLELSADALARRASLDRETAAHVLEIIEAEFEKGPGVVESLERGRFTVESVLDEEESAGEGVEEEPSDAASSEAASSEAASSEAPPEEETPSQDETPGGESVTGEATSSGKASPAPSEPADTSSARSEEPIAPSSASHTEREPDMPSDEDDTSEETDPATPESVSSPMAEESISEEDV